MNAVITHVTAKRIVLRCEKIGTVTLSKFSPDFDHGLYRDRPWHVVTFESNFATVEECLAFLQEVESRWEDEEPPSVNASSECEGAYLRVE